MKIEYPFFLLLKLNEKDQIILNDTGNFAWSPLPNGAYFVYYFARSLADAKNKLNVLKEKIDDFDSKILPVPLDWLEEYFYKIKCMARMVNEIPMVLDNLQLLNDEELNEILAAAQKELKKKKRRHQRRYKKPKKIIEQIELLKNTPNKIDEKIEVIRESAHLNVSITDQFIKPNLIEILEKKGYKIEK